MGHRERQEIAFTHEKEEIVRSILGVRGYNICVNCAPYLSSTLSFPLPVMHLLLRGVLEDLLQAMFGKNRDVQWLEPAYRELISARAEGVRRVAEIGKQYRDVTQ